MKRGCLVVALMVTVLLSARPAAGQDAVKAEIRQIIDAAYPSVFWKGRDIKALLAGLDHAAIKPYLIPAIGGRADAVSGEVVYGGITDIVVGHANEVDPPERNGLRFLCPVIDVTGGMAMAQVEVVRGERIRETGYLPVVKTKTGWKIVGLVEHRHENGARPQTPAGEADAVKKVVEDALVRGLMQDGTYEQARAGIASVCDTRLYLPEVDVVTRLDLALPFKAKLRGAKPLPIKSSAFTLIGITGEIAAGKLAVAFDPGPEMTMYVALLKLKTGWAIVEIVTDKDPLWTIFPRPTGAP